MKIIHVFKTSVTSQKDIKRIKPYLIELLGESKWNFDLEDCDNILRVESEKDLSFEVVSILRKLDFDGEELPD